MSLARVEVGLPVQAYPHKAWDRIPKGVKLEDLWQLCGPQVDKHMQSLPLWKVFCLVYFEGIAHGAGAERARADRESQETEGAPT